MSRRPGHRPPRQVRVLMSRWDQGWDLFLLDPDDGLLGRARVEDRDQVEPAVRAYLREHHPVHAEEQIVVVER
jgi:hypothetical protein